MINVFIGFLASFSLGVFHRHLEQLDKAMLRLYPLKPNRSMILEHIKSNCSELIVKYPEFDMDTKIDLCRGNQLSLKLVTIAIILSTLYNICLLYGLYGSVLLSSIIMGISSIFLLNTSLSNDGQILHNLEIILFIIGLGMILCHIVFANSNNRLSKRQKIRLKEKITIFMLKNINPETNNKINELLDIIQFLFFIPCNILFVYI